MPRRRPAARRTAPTRCPHCEASVPPRALACPECGSDARSGWSDDAEAWAGDLPSGYGDDDDEFDDAAYQEFLRSEGLSDDGLPSAAARRRALTVVIVAVLVVCTLLALLR